MDISFRESEFWRQLLKLIDDANYVMHLYVKTYIVPFLIKLFN